MDPSPARSRPVRGSGPNETGRVVFGSLQNGRVQIDPEVAAECHERVADQLLVSPRPRGDRSFRQRQPLVWNDARRIEVVNGAEALTLRARAVRRVEGERARGHLGHADPALRARQPPGEEPIAAFERIDHHDVVGEVQGDLDRLGEPALESRLRDEPIDNDVNRVVATAVEFDLIVQREELAVDSDPREAALPELEELFLNSPFLPARPAPGC